MRLSSPRVPPLAESEWSDEARAVLEPARGMAGGKTLNIFATLARHPGLLKRWLVFGNHVLFKSTLPPREREFVILRTGWLCQSEYEWAQHVVIGQAVGLTEEEVERIAHGPDADGWSANDKTLLHATDELVEDSFISDATWKALSRTYSTEELIDIIFTVGQYNLVSMALNTLGVQLDAGLKGFPAVPRG